MVVIGRSLVIALLLLAPLALVPHTASDEGETKRYITLGGHEGATGENLGLGLLLFPEPENCGFAGCGQFPELGGARFYADGHHTSLTLLLDDEVFDRPATALCVLGDGSVCDDNDAYGTACGARHVTQLPFGFDGVTVWTYTVQIESDLGVCLGSTGTITAQFS